jgi:hypothetical protein
MNYELLTMNINRHNYEEFFLLYADNELCAADRRAVEVFVAENADLKKELQLILQTISGADAVVFNNKELLMKPAITPLQEQLLLFTDNEQTAADKEKTQQLINTDVAAAKEFALLQQTKLQPDTAVVYANKKELYRKEEGRVVRIAWWRVAAAAVLLLGFGTWGVLTLVKPAINESGTMATDKPVTPAIQKNTASNITANTATAQPPVKENNTPTAVVTNTAPANTIAAPIKNTLPANNTIKQKTTPVVIDTDNNLAKKEDNNLPKPLYNNFNNNSSNETITANVTPSNEGTEKVKSGTTNNVTSLTQSNTGAVNGYAINASFTDQSNNEPEEASADENKSKRTKLGGFIRKVKRLVERNTNVKTGNGIKVAGFDIALNK